MSESITIEPEIAVIVAPSESRNNINGNEGEYGNKRDDVTYIHHPFEITALKIAYFFHFQNQIRNVW